MYVYVWICMNKYVAIDLFFCTICTMDVLNVNTCKYNGHLAAVLKIHIYYNKVFFKKYLKWRLIRTYKGLVTNSLHLLQRV